VASLTRFQDRFRGRMSLHPTQVVLFAYLFLITVGALVLTLPMATVGTPLSFIDAFFTSTSAVSVTGLTVLDVSSTLSDFGKVVLLVLIQLGGLGIMVVSGFIAIFVFRRLSTSGTDLISTEFRTPSDLGSMREIIIRIITLVLFFQVIGAIILAAWLAFVYDYEIGKALWSGVFHSISAFNQAGFSLYPDSLMQFVYDPVISLTVAALVLISGVGFPVLLELRRVGWAPRVWTMNLNIVLAMTVFLTIGGTIYIAVLEWSNPNSLGPLDTFTKIMAAFFHSVQTRSGGLNTLDIGLFLPETWLGLDALMFIGAGPSSTGGGIRITTFAVLAYIVWTELRGDSAVNIFGKRLSRSVHRQAITIALLAVAYVALSTVLMQVVTDIDTDKIIFEVISAFGTVGLSTGITPSLPDAALINLIVLMIVGRLGPLTLSTALVLAHRPNLYEFPKERPLLG
jgi:potassium uptake TrkH family protein